MEILCPQCATRFRLPADRLGPEGRRLRCSKCGHTWFQAPPESAAGKEAAGAKPAKAPLRPAPPPPAAAAARTAAREEAEQRPSAKTGAASRPPAGEGEPAAGRSAAPSLTAERPASSKAEATRSPAAAKPAADKPAPDKPAPDKPAPDKPAAAKPAADKPAEGARAVPASDLPGGDERLLRRRMDDLRRKRQRGMGRVLLAGWILFLLVLVLAGAAAWFARDWVVARWPQAIRLYEAVGVEVQQPGWGLALEGIEERYRPAGESDGGEGQVLELVGRVVNESDSARPVPPIRVAILDAGGRILVSEEVAPQDRQLAPGAATAFEVSLTMPEAATDYRVSFVATP